MSDCLFCKIVAGDIPAKKVYEDDHFLAFEDIAPKADIHVLVIPKKHIESLAKAQKEDAEILGALTLLLPKIAKDLGLADGFRTIVNTGPKGGQVVNHLHYHILGGRLPSFE